MRSTSGKFLHDLREIGPRRDLCPTLKMPPDPLSHGASFVRKMDKAGIRAGAPRQRKRPNVSGWASEDSILFGFKGTIPPPRSEEQAVLRVDSAKTQQLGSSGRIAIKQPPEPLRSPRKANPGGGLGCAFPKGTDTCGWRIISIHFCEVLNAVRTGQIQCSETTR